MLLQDHGSWWLTRIILLLEVAADLSCFWIARKKIAAAKNAGDWFAGLRQTVVADTSWRTDPPRFPVRWLMPALAVTAGTALIVNRDDPAIMVGARFGVGWTSNFANPLAWLIIGGIVAAPAGLTLILRAAVM